jgi:hypothetical protein
MSLILDESYTENTDIMDLLRSGDRLCKLACILYPKVKCQLLSKGSEFGIHKSVFFLELCKSVGIRAQALCTLSDILFGHLIEGSYAGTLNVLRTVVALEKQARKKGWEGPKMSLKSDTPENKGNIVPIMKAPPRVHSSGKMRDAAPPKPPASESIPQETIATPTPKESPIANIVRDELPMLPATTESEAFISVSTMFEKASSAGLVATDIAKPEDLPDYPKHHHLKHPPRHLLNHLNLPRKKYHMNQGRRRLKI